MFNPFRRSKPEPPTECIVPGSYQLGFPKLVVDEAYGARMEYPILGHPKYRALLVVPSAGSVAVVVHATPPIETPEVFVSPEL